MNPRPVRPRTMWMNTVVSLQDQDRLFAGPNARRSRSEMAAEHAVLGDPQIDEKGRCRRPPEPIA